MFLLSNERMNLMNKTLIELYQLCKIAYINPSSFSFLEALFCTPTILVFNVFLWALSFYAYCRLLTRVTACEFFISLISDFK